MAKKVLTAQFSEPLNEATTALVDLHAGDGNLTIDRLDGSGQTLASGSLQYLENQGLPTCSLVLMNGQASLTLKGGRAERPRFHLPWEACNGATDWQVKLNSTVPSDITAHSDGGNIKLNLAGMTVTRLSASTGGGNIDMVLPEAASILSVIAKTGAGNVDVSLPTGLPARIHATTGLGKTIVDPQFSKTDKNTYQSSDFEQAINKVEITIHSGAGNVMVNTR